MRKFKSEALKATDYKHLQQREHVYKVPDTYVGSCLPTRTLEWILNLNTGKAERLDINLPEAVSRLFLEIISNAADSVSNYKMSVAGSQSQMPENKPIEVSMDHHTVKIRNYGRPITIEKTKALIDGQERELHLPEMIFGVLLSSSNYDETQIRLGCGRNGYGAKLVNIFSKTFEIEIADNVNRTRYFQRWTNNMIDVESPVITEHVSNESYVEVTYTLDFKRFGYEKYPDEAFHLFSRYCADFSLSGKFPVVFNGMTIDCSDIMKCAKLYFPESVLETAVHHIQYPTTVPNGMSKKTFKIYPEVELLVLDTPDDGDVKISFANGIMTRDGGVHVKAAMDSIAKIILEHVNKKTTIKLTLTDLKPHLSFILNCRLQNPSFGGQTKHTLIGPEVSIILSPQHSSTMMKWNIVNNLNSIIRMKETKILVKTDGKKLKHIDCKGESANFAGDRDKWKDCTLIVVEGNSAKSYAGNLISHLENGPDFYGTFPLKGKPLNFRNAEIEKIDQNKEYGELKKALGLHESTEDKIVDYKNPETRQAHLRYGQVWIMTDADVDGKHIAGLFYDLFSQQFPSLLEIGFVKLYRTPIIRVTGFKNGDIKKFYNAREFENWERTVDLKKMGLEVKYYKGLGTINETEAYYDSKEPLRVVDSVLDDLALENLRLAFDNKEAEYRKNWLRDWTPSDFFIENHLKMDISKFVNEELIQYGIANVERSIPKILDGLKISQRKLLWTMLMQNKGYSVNEKIKVAQFAPNCAGFTNYHYGEASLSLATIGMAQHFVGSNNVAFFNDIGQFGTRKEGGKDAAAARYIFTNLHALIPYIFKEIDINILTSVIDEGKPFEPETFLPIIPMILVNGGCGVATGHSTFIPCFSPKDLAQRLCDKIKGRVMKKLKPWYHDFEGRIVEKDLKYKEFKQLSDSVVDSGEPLNSSSGELSGEPLDEPLGELPLNNPSIESPSEDPEKIINTMVSIGNFTVQKNVVTVTELPIGRWYLDYRKWLIKEVKAGKIRDFDVKKPDCGIDTKKKMTKKEEKSEMKNNAVQHFRIVMFANNNKPTYDSLNLIKPFSLSNMVALNMNNRPDKYKTAEEIFDKFFDLRLPYFQIRKDFILATLTAKVEKMDTKSRFIHAYLNHDIIIDKKSKAEIKTQLTALGFDTDLLTQVHLGNLTLEELEDLDRKINVLKDEMNVLIGKTPQDLWLADLEEFLKEYHDFELKGHDEYNKKKRK